MRAAEAVLVYEHACKYQHTCSSMREAEVVLLYEHACMH
jgi:hypothetical protein